MAGMDGGMRVSNPKSGTHTILRTSMLPGLLDILGRNVHEPYPHRLYETGRVLERYGTAAESLRLGCVTAHKDASYSEIKSILYAVLRRGLGLEDISTPPADSPTYRPGTAADIMVDGTRVGTLGEVDGDILRAFRLREHTKAAAFEADVELIFGGVDGKSAP
jgi:phenylalanyl-tRNA synthetase beta chain